jgi:hypothetical protein
LGEEKIGVVDLRTMTVVKRLATAAKPNGSTYAVPFHKMYVSDTLGKAVAGVNVEKDEIVKRLEFKSETGMPQYDSVSRKVYVNLRNTDEVAEIEPVSDAVLGTYPVEGCRYNHGMAIDSAHHRAFLLCGGTKTLTVFALDTHKAIAHLPLPAGADVVKFDPGLGRIYAACSSGFIAVIQAQDCAEALKGGLHALIHRSIPICCIGMGTSQPTSTARENHRIAKRGGPHRPFVRRCGRRTPLRFGAWQQHGRSHRYKGRHTSKDD